MYIGRKDQEIKWKRAYLPKQFDAPQQVHVYFADEDELVKKLGGEFSSDYMLVSPVPLEIGHDSEIAEILNPKKPYLKLSSRMFDFLGSSMISVIGAGNHFEVWNTERLSALEKLLSEQDNIDYPPIYLT
jgi:hypothetical protein